VADRFCSGGAVTIIGAAQDSRAESGRSVYGIPQEQAEASGNVKNPFKRISPTRTTGASSQCRCFEERQ